MQTTTVATDFHNLPLNVLIPSKTNPRRIVEDDALRELAESIRVNGVIEPLIVRPVAEMFEVVAGGRRYLGSKLAEKNTAPCHVRELTDAQVLEIQLVELSIVVKRFLSLYVGSHVVSM
jgi:ParB family chromosome partitioning protein